MHKLPWPDANDSAPPAPPATLPLKFRKYDLTETGCGRLAPHRHTLKLHNDMSEAVDVYIAPRRARKQIPGRI